LVPWAVGHCKRFQALQIGQLQERILKAFAAWAGVPVWGGSRRSPGPESPLPGLVGAPLLHGHLGPGKGLRAEAHEAQAAGGHPPVIKYPPRWFADTAMHPVPDSAIAFSLSEHSRGGTQAFFWVSWKLEGKGSSPTIVSAFSKRPGRARYRAELSRGQPPKFPS